MKYKTKIEKIFKAWTDRDWDFVERALTNDFTFTTQRDDHISKKEFKETCWDNIEQIGEFEIITIVEGEREAFIRYKNTINNERVQNAEQFVFDEGGKIKSVTVFFGRPDDE